MEATLCNACKKAASKYRCSKCRAFKYCSIPCFNEHKETCAPAAAAPAAPATETKSAPAAAAEDGSQVVDARALAALKDNDAIRSALTSRELRDIITRIDGAKSEALRGAMLSDELELNPRFTDFMQAVLDTVHGATPNTAHAAGAVAVPGAGVVAIPSGRAAVLGGLALPTGESGAAEFGAGGVGLPGGRVAMPGD